MKTIVSAASILLKSVGEFLWVHREHIKEQELGVPTTFNTHLQFFLIKVAQPLQRGHLIEAIQEGFGLLFHAPRETPVSQQPKTKTSHWWSPGPHALPACPCDRMTQKQ